MRTYFALSKLEGVLEAMKIEISQIPITDNLPPNLSRSEHKALRELKCDKDLIINKADKGSTIVVQNRTDYIKAALEHLNDPVTYTVLDGDPTSAIYSGIDSSLQDIYNKGLLDKDMVAFCSSSKKARPARLYLLKKIHKNPMGIRPIVSSCESPTENISQFVDYWLQPIIKNLPSYLKDTSHLIRELKQIFIAPNTILVTVDVKSLYTCIPHVDRITACREALNSTLESNPDRPDISVLICLLEIVLKTTRLSLIKSAKRAITAILKNADVKDEELMTAFCGAEALINSRPLIYQSANVKDNVPLTPNHFLHGQMGGQLAPEVIDEVEYD